MNKLYPVVMHTTDERSGTYSLVKQIVQRFERVNDMDVHLLTYEDMRYKADLDLNRYWYPVWVWDFVPRCVDYVLCMDSKVLCANPLPPLDLTNIEFAAVPDRMERIQEARQKSKVINKFGMYYQMFVFIAHRSTRKTFETLQKRHAKEPRLGPDGRGHMTPFNEEIQSNHVICPLPKTWNWSITYEREFFTQDPYLISFNGCMTWAYIMYILGLLNRLDGINQ
jgi:hypothetical protein